MLHQLSQDTLAQARAILSKLDPSNVLNKAIDLSTGLTGVNLEAPAKLLVPLLSPFRQSIGRKTIGGSSTTWKRITAVTPTGSFFPTEGVKAGVQTYTTDNPSATFRSYGRGDTVTWEGEIAGRNFEDVRARAESLVLLQTLREEELNILGGNRTALSGASSGVGPAAVAAAHAGGSLADDEYFVGITALTLEGVSRASRIDRPTTTGSGTNRYDFSASVPTLDHTVGETAIGTEASATTATTNNSVKVTWTAIPGAAAYGVYVGLTTNTKKLVGIVTQSEIVIDALPALTGAAEPSTDTTANTKAFDGILAQLVAAGSGAYVKRVNGPLSAAVGHQIPELASMIQNIYDRTKVEPDRLVMGWQEADQIDTLLSSVANDRVSIVYPATDGGPVFKKFQQISSPVTGKAIPIESQPNLPGGMVLALIDNVPYPNSELPNAWQMHMGSDFVRIDYALTDPKFEFEMRAFGALAGYAPALQGVLYDVHRF